MWNQRWRVYELFWIFVSVCISNLDDRLKNDRLLAMNTFVHYESTQKMSEHAKKWVVRAKKSISAPHNSLENAKTWAFGHFHWIVVQHSKSPTICSFLTLKLGGIDQTLLLTGQLQAFRRVPPKNQLIVPCPLERCYVNFVDLIIDFRWFLSVWRFL